MPGSRIAERRWNAKKGKLLKMNIWPGVVIAVMGLAFAKSGFSTPVTYTGSVVTDIKLAGHRYHNAAVTITFTGDTNGFAAATDPTGAPIPSSICPSVNNPKYAGINRAGPYFYFLREGHASLRFESQGKTFSAKFLPKQIFVSFDLCNGGVGFGSFTGPLGMEPAYPLAFTGGTAMGFSFNAVKPLSTSANLTGYAWSCIGYPYTNGACGSADSYPLHTDAGDVSVYMPYQYLVLPGFLSPHSGSVNRGIFSIVVGP